MLWVDALCFFFSLMRACSRRLNIWLRIVGMFRQIAKSNLTSKERGIVGASVVASWLAGRLSDANSATPEMNSLLMLLLILDSGYDYDTHHSLSKN